MLKSRLLHLLFCFIGACASIYVLFLYSQKASSYKNGFLRFFPLHKIKGDRFIPLPNQSFYIAGANKRFLYLGNHANPANIFRIDLNSGDIFTQRINFSFPGADTISFFQEAYYKVDAGVIYLIDGVKRLVAYGNLGEMNLSQLKMTPPFFSAMPLSPVDYVLKVAVKSEPYLIKVSNYHISPPFSLQKRATEIFSSDGVLVKALGQPNFFYVYSYRNQYLAFDSSFNLLYIGKTIDTISQIPLKVRSLQLGKQRVIGSPRRYVNMQCAVNKQYIFIRSAVKADNEIKSQFDESSVVDVYSLGTRKYEFSFYLENLKGEKLRDIFVSDNLLITLYSSFIYVYKLDL